ncbi:hypothetical protein LguiA_023957 [Lonicera macranthoides]
MLILGWMTMALVATAEKVAPPKYGEALRKSILFFEGQRSGKLPTNQRLTWRKDSALTDGSDMGVDLVGGYYDAGDNVKFNFPMAFSTTMLAWSVIEFGKSMTTSDTSHALDAIKWSTDYFLKATSQPDVVFAQVGEPNSDHNCWQRPEDMDTPRTTFAVTKDSPGSEVSAEIAAALAASSMVFKHVDPAYSKLLLQRAFKVFEFADRYQGSYNDGTMGQWVCPFYCDYSGYQDELIWGAAWLYKATGSSLYWNYVNNNFNNLVGPNNAGIFAEFGWDTKHAGINVLVSKFILEMNLKPSPFVPYADYFVCNMLPESSDNTIEYSPGGLIFRPGGCNMQHTTALSFLLLTYSRYLKSAKRVIHCGNIVVTPSRLVHFARAQVDYILGKNPMNISYMVGFGKKYPNRIHHRASSLPSIDQHPQHIQCKDGTPYFISNDSNPNKLIGAVVGGPDIKDSFADYRQDATHSEPTTYVNAPLVGLLAYFKGNP